MAFFYYSIFLCLLLCIKTSWASLDASQMNSLLSETMREPSATFAARKPSLYNRKAARSRRPINGAPTWSHWKAIYAKLRPISEISKLSLASDARAWSPWRAINAICCWHQQCHQRSEGIKSKRSTGRQTAIWTKWAICTPIKIVVFWVKQT